MYWYYRLSVMVAIHSLGNVSVVILVNHSLVTQLQVSDAINAACLGIITGQMLLVALWLGFNLLPLGRGLVAACCSMLYLIVVAVIVSRQPFMNVAIALLSLLMIAAFIFMLYRYLWFCLGVPRKLGDVYHGGMTPRVIATLFVLLGVSLFAFINGPLGLYLAIIVSISGLFGAWAALSNQYISIRMIYGVLFSSFSGMGPAITVFRIDTGFGLWLMIIPIVAYCVQFGTLAGLRPIGCRVMPPQLALVRGAAPGSGRTG